MNCKIPTLSYQLSGINYGLAFTGFALGFFALCQVAQAVTPAPDGGYAGGNTAEGQNALLSLTTGTYNTAVGFFSLTTNTQGQFNTAVGAGALLANTAELNTATGAAALLNNTIGFQNTANGAFALLSNTTGSDNTASGFGALQLNTTGSLNTAVGLSALGPNTTGGVNTAAGALSLASNTTGVSNTATGAQALFVNSTGSNNTASGYQALGANTAGGGNTAIGYQALNHNTIGSNNIVLGAGAGSNIVTASDTICIGAAGVDVTDGCYIGHVFEEAIDPDNLTMAVDVHGKVGTLPSSRRFKDDIRSMDKASEAILALKPVTFHYKSDKNCSPRFGLIAEEVAEVNSNLVARDKDGKPYSVRYDQVNAMLLNEFLKEHRKVQQQETTIAQLQLAARDQQKHFESNLAKQQKQIAALAASLQGVKAELQLTRRPVRVLANNP